MNFDQFSRAVFNSLAPDASAARLLSDELQAAVLAELDAVVRDRFSAIVAELNARGHELAPYDTQSAGEQHYRDYSDPTCCALRLAVDVTLSAGFQDVRGEHGWGERPR
jgi:hypothetical protein